MLVAFLAGCGEVPPPPPFEGARPVVLDSIRNKRTPTSQEIEELVDALIDVAGGAERLERLSWRRIEDLYLARTGNLLGNQVACTTLVRPDSSVRTQLDYLGGESEARIRLRGQEYHVPRVSGQPAPRPIKTVGAARLYAGWDWISARLPVLVSEASSLAPLPPREEDGRTLVGVRVDVADLEPKFEAWIDPSGPMIVEARAELPVTGDLTPRAKAVHSVRFSDFRRVQGILFPFRRDLYVDGTRFGLAETHTLKLDVELRDQDFLPD
jgi:hypothetical protein